MSSLTRSILLAFSVLPCAVALSAPSMAGSILQVENSTNLTLTLSDLIAYGAGTQQKTILQLNNAADDITMRTDAIRTFDAGFEVKKFFISRTKEDGSEIKTGLFNVTQLGPKPLGFVSDPSGVQELFASIDYDLATPPPAEGTLLTFAGGQNPALPGWFVGIAADFDNGTVSGPYTGPGEILSGFEVAAVVPEPTTLLLVGTTAAGLGLARWRQRRRQHAEL